MTETSSAIYPGHVIMPRAVWEKCQKMADYFESELVKARTRMAELEAQNQILSAEVLKQQTPVDRTPA